MNDIKAPLKGEPYTPTAVELDRCFSVDFIEFYKHFYRKKILLVGGANSIDQLSLSAFVDEEYKIVQLNHHLTRRPNQPCDWLIARAGSGMDLDLLKTLPQYKQITFISTACHKHTFKEFFDHRKFYVWPFHEYRYARTNPFHPALEWCNQFWNELNTNPTIGMLALRMIQILPVAEIRLIGFDFWHDKQKGFEALRSGCHHLPTQIKWLKHQYHTDHRITLDPMLLKLLGIETRGYWDTYEIEEDWVKKV